MHKSSSALPDYSIVVPCYNSDQSVRELVLALRRVFQHDISNSFEILLIDDGSPSPDTWRTLEDLGRMFDEVRSIKLSRNFGKPGALMCGYSLAAGRWIIAMDDDLQHDPRDIPALLKHKEHALVMAQFPHRKHVFWQRYAGAVKSWLDYKLIGKPRNVTLSPFHVIRRETLDQILRLKSPTPHVGALMMYVTRDVVMVPARHHARKYGRTTYTIRQRWGQLSNLLINNSSLLLTLVARLGVLIALFSILFGVSLIYTRFVVGRIVPGWTSLMVAILLLGGLMLFSLGVIGEYLLRIINGLECRPPFIVDRIVSNDSLPDSALKPVDGLVPHEREII